MFAAFRGLMGKPVKRNDDGVWGVYRNKEEPNGSWEIDHNVGGFVIVEKRAPFATGSLLPIEALRESAGGLAARDFRLGDDWEAILPAGWKLAPQNGGAVRSDGMFAVVCHNQVYYALERTEDHYKIDHTQFLIRGHANTLAEACDLLTNSA